MKIERYFYVINQNVPYQNMAYTERAFLLFDGGDYFKYFLQKRAVIGGRLLIEGQLSFEEIW